MTQNRLSDKIEAYLNPKFPDYLALLRQMVEINSFSANPAGVNALSELTAQAFTPLGFTAEMIQADNPKYGKHLVLTRPGTTGRTIGCVSHLDTVFTPEEEHANDFSWREDGERIYGPGTNDIKGGTVMMLMVLNALKTVAPDAFDEITWVLCLNAAEERLSDDFGPLCLERFGPDAPACLVFEAGMLQDDTFRLAVTRKGRAQFEVNVTGKSAHAGNGHQVGANAVVQLSRTIGQIADLTDYKRDLTFNVGVVSGGTVVNRVPHLAQAHVEMRTFATDVFDTGVADIMALNGPGTVRSAEDDYPCRVEISMTEQTPPWPQNRGTDHLYAIWQEAAQELGLKTQRENRGGLSDGNHLWQRIPTLDALGPAGANAHCSERSEDGSKDQEYAIASSFIPKAVLNVTAILKLIERETGR